jgi:hypothetical protein
MLIWSKTTDFSTKKKAHIYTGQTYFWSCSVCGHLFVEHLIQKSWALIWSWSPLCCYNSLHSSGRLSTRCWNIAAGSFFHSATRALVKSGTNVGRLGLARCVFQSNVFIKAFLHQQMSQSAIQKPSLNPQTESNADVEGVWWGWGLGSVQASQVLPHRSRQTIYVWTLLCARGLARPWKLIWWSSRRTVLMLTLLPEAVLFLVFY